MLLRVILENFRSFGEPVQFDMFPNPKRTSHESHVYPKRIPLLKMAAVYGANGSGKSNLVKGIKFIQNFATSSDFYKLVNVPECIHRGGAGDNNISAQIEFEANGKYFIYSFTLSSDRVISETLYRSGTGTAPNSVVFNRELDAVTLGDDVSGDVQQAIASLLAKNPTTSLLKLNEQFPIINDDSVQLASQWFQRSLVVVPFNSIVVKLIELMDANPKLLEFTNRVISNVDLGISNISIREELFEEWIKNKVHRPYGKITSELDTDTALGVLHDNRQILAAKNDRGQTTIREFVFNHIGANGTQFEMNINGESDGTVRLLNLIPALYGATHEGETVIVDEIDHSVHPLLIHALIRLFSQGETNGQLIFTTHETCLLDQKTLLRPDEVWFAEKSEGMSKLYSLNDFRLHNTLSIENGYIDGRFGAIPFVGNIEWLQ